MVHQHEADVQALEAFVADNPELERLEALLDQFNIFEALGVTRQELRHSDFLAYMLDPRRPHGLGDAFVKHLLRRVLADRRGRQLPIGLIDLDVWDFNRMSVWREWEHIDILLLDEAHRFAVIIENKVDSGEHSNQLQRYWDVVQRSYPGWRVVGFYLTPDSAPPSDTRFFALGYATVCTTLEALIERRAATLSADVRLLITHYTQMLRRHMMGNSEIGQLCQRIYTRHRRAFELINRHMQERAETRRKLLEGLIKQCAAPKLALEPGSGGGFYTRFIPQAWDVPALRVGKGWTQSRRMLLLEFENKPDSLLLALTIGPGPGEVRSGLFKMALEHRDVFDPGAMAIWPRYHRILQHQILTADQIGDLSDADVAVEIRRFWHAFLESDLPAVEAALRAQPWIWQTTAAAQPAPAEEPTEPSAEELEAEEPGELPTEELPEE